MMNESRLLTPADTIELAIAAYDVKINTDRAKKNLKSRLIGLVEIPDDVCDDSSYIKGESGGIFLRKDSGFGFCGYRSRKYKEDLVISLRGTASFHDVLTDAYFKTSPTKRSHPVHGGFNRCFNSLWNDIDNFLKKHRPTAAVHCVGHSLGGALATLVADRVSQDYKCDNVYLYTLGSPRVGTDMFCNTFTKNIKPDNIFRLQHTADPVAAVPIWPFMHVPARQPGLLMDRFGFGFQFAAHSSGQYARSVENKRWLDLKQDAKAIASADQIERWLESKKPASFTGKTMLLLSEAIYFVLKKIGLSSVVHVATNSVATLGYTLLDMLALALKKGLKLAESISKWVKYLVVKMLQMLGRTVKNIDSYLNQTFIAQLLKDMHRKVHLEVSKALEALRN